MFDLMMEALRFGLVGSVGASISIFFYKLAGGS